MKYELLIKGINGNKAKIGDVIAVRPYPWDWGLKEIKGYLVVIIESTMSFEAFEKKIDYYDYENTFLSSKGELVIPVFVSPPFSISMQDLKNEVPDLDIAKVLNPGIIYQPFKSATQMIRRFNGRNGSRLIGLNDVDTRSAQASTEIEINLGQGKQIAQDKVQNLKVVL